MIYKLLDTYTFDFITPQDQYTLFCPKDSLVKVIGSDVFVKCPDWPEYKETINTTVVVDDIVKLGIVILIEQ